MIYLYGAGGACENFLKFCEQINFKIDEVVDSDLKKKGNLISGKKIEYIENIKIESRDIFIVTSSFMSEIYTLLKFKKAKRILYYEDVIWGIKKGYSLEYIEIHTHEIGITRQYENQFKNIKELYEGNAFKDKINRRKLGVGLKELSDFVDKVKVKSFVKGLIGEEFLIKTLGTYKAVEEIEFNRIETKVIFKLNHGCGYNLVYTPGESQISIVKEQLHKWLNSNFYWNSYEIQYKNIEPLILMEEYIESKDGLVDYKFFCNYGKISFLQVDYDRNEYHKQNFYDEKFQPNYITGYKEFDYNIKLNENVIKCRKIVECLAKKFEFVRVDMYIVEEKILFGELTFTPHSGNVQYKPLELDEKLVKYKFSIK